MAKFRTEIGYGHDAVTSPGVHETVITERKYYGEEVRNSRTQSAGDDLNPDMNFSLSLSVMADVYAFGNIYAIKYVRWAGSLWTVTSVEPKRPRLILGIGGVYNGQTPATGEAPASP